MEHEIPKVVLYQAINFLCLVGLLYYFLRKPTKAYFAKRHDDLTSAIREAKRLKDEAEAKHQEYVLKIKNLEAESTKILNQIKAEGEASKTRMIEEARRISETIQTEAKRTANNEVEKARAELYDDVLEQALVGARTLLTKSVAEKDQLRLQKEFVEKIEAVQ
jgi:F-type H+-transporting ATPase subunit b